MSSPIQGQSIVAACVCGEVYELKPDYAGMLLECPTCGRHLRAGRHPGAARVSTPGVDQAFDRDLFLLRERVFTITSKYEVWSEAGTPILYVERPAYLLRTLAAYILGFFVSAIVFGATTSVSRGESLLAIVGYGLAVAAFVIVSMSARPLRHVTVYRDDSRREVLMRVRQDQRLAFLVRTYTVMTGDGTTLALLRKNYIHNLLRKRWTIETPAGGILALAIEESVVLSLLRRVLGTFFGLLRTNFVFERPNGEELGEFNRKFTLFDRYVLDLRPDVGQTLDRRVALATGVMLDTGERR